MRVLALALAVAVVAGPSWAQGDPWRNSAPPRPPASATKVDCATHSRGAATCAIGFAAYAGTIVGAATFCGAPRERIYPFTRAAIAAIVRVGRNDDDRARAVDQIEANIQATQGRLARGEERISCRQVVGILEDAERLIGLR
jgi:hypothetical protein